MAMAAHAGMLRSAALVGAGLSLGSLPVHLVLPHEWSVQLAAVLLAVIGAVYVGFALQKGSPRQIQTEILVATAFLALALGGMWWRPWLIPLAYVLHGAWDWAHHHRGGTCGDSRLVSAVLRHL
jgi:chromate transport protein ChrA